jgi:hypothetical protein
MLAEATRSLLWVFYFPCFSTVAHARRKARQRHEVDADLVVARVIAGSLSLECCAVPN